VLGQLVVEVQALVEQQVFVVVEQEELEEELQSSYFDPEEVEDLGKNVEVLETNAQRVDKVQSSCIGILEACPFLQ
jgi:hypothetical protein